MILAFASPTAIKSDSETSLIRFHLLKRDNKSTLGADTGNGI